MEIKLYKKPTGPIIIEGFPGFGLVGTIASEFLVDHLKTEMIGKIIFEDMPALVAIHENKVVEPLGIFYSKEYNMIILHAVTAPTGFEWELANKLVEMAVTLKAKEIVALEGVGSGEEIEEPKAFYYASKDNKKKVFNNMGIEPLREGIIMGVTGSLLLKADKVPISCIFAETHSALPDSKAAAKVIQVIDKYLGLSVDYKPLLQQAEKFENKLRGILQQSQKVQDLSEQKKMSYVG